MTDFLAPDICGDLRYFVNSTPIFHRDIDERANWNMLCAMMDRVEDSVSYLNKHADFPQNADEFLLFMLYSCTIQDAVVNVGWKLGIEYKRISQSFGPFFQDCCERYRFCSPDGSAVPDDIFFKYIRALTFAHPLATKKFDFLHNATHYSPFVMINDKISCSPGCIEMMVYSSADDEQLRIEIPFDNIKAYIASRYNILRIVTEELKKRKSDKEALWRQRKVARNLEPIAVLADIKSILIERYINPYDIDTLITILSYHYTNLDNIGNVQRVQGEIISKIPEMCDCVDNLDEIGLEDIVDAFLYARPGKEWCDAHYQIRKILENLRDDINESCQRFGLDMADVFARQFANKFFVIDVQQMDYEEIKLLTRMACFLEKREQERNAV